MVHVAVGRTCHQMSAQIISVFNNSSVVMMPMVAIIICAVMLCMHLFARYRFKYIVSMFFACIATIVIDIQSTTNASNKHC